jgi:hypothetical protein
MMARWCNGQHVLRDAGRRRFDSGLRLHHGETPMTKIEIEYRRSGVPVSDFEAEEWLRDVVADHLSGGEPSLYEVSTSLPIHLVRLAIVTGKLRAEDVAFVHDGKSFSANEYGAITDWPDGFADAGGRVCEKILRAAMAKRRAERARASSAVPPTGG